MSVLYTASALSTGDGRNGHVRSSDGVLDLDLATPTEMGGPGGATNPEQMFAAGYAACFHSALKGAARREKVTLADSSVTADVGIGPRDEGGFGLTVALHVELGGLDQAEADKLVAAAHQMCPYSNATRGNVDVAIDTTVA
ncbi:MAG: organic hydroperoxide resistance protein [Pseudonocardia sp.]|nr:organic hydroperoxide resistance protein [Pseudonocardia sp.]